jgi:hypothetical protein
MDDISAQKDRSIDADDVGAIDRPEIPAVEAIGHMIGNHEILALAKDTTTASDRQRMAVTIMGSGG